MPSCDKRLYSYGFFGYVALIHEKECPLAPEAGNSLSMIFTSAPYFTSSYAIIVPMIPAPITTIFGLFSI